MLHDKKKGILNWQHQARSARGSWGEIESGKAGRWWQPKPDAHSANMLGM